MRRYAIAKFLTDEEKARAVGAEYVPTTLIFGDETPTWRTVVEHACPLGMALWGTGNPDPMDVADTLVRSGRGAYSEMRLAARTFMRYWDRGQIAPDQLAAALGVDQ